MVPAGRRTHGRAMSRGSSTDSGAAALPAGQRLQRGSALTMHCPRPLPAAPRRPMHCLKLSFFVSLTVRLHNEPAAAAAHGEHAAGLHTKGDGENSAPVVCLPQQARPQRAQRPQVLHNHLTAVPAFLAMPHRLHSHTDLHCDVDHSRRRLGSCVGDVVRRQAAPQRRGACGAQVHRRAAGAGGTAAARLRMREEGGGQAVCRGGVERCRRMSSSAGRWHCRGRQAAACCSSCASSQPSQARTCEPTLRLLQGFAEPAAGCRVRCTRPCCRRLLLCLLPRHVVGLRTERHAARQQSHAAG